MDECRLPSTLFKAERYMARYQDLRDVFGATNWSAAAQHWVQFGIKEGRLGN